MSNFIQDFEEDDQFRSTVEHGADGSTPTTTISKKKRSLPGNPGKQTYPLFRLIGYPDAEVVALSPRTLMATNRKDSFVAHTAFCDALTEVNNHNLTATQRQAQEMCSDGVLMSSNFDQILYPSALAIGSAYTSATALLQKAAEIGAKMSDKTITPILLRGFTGYSTSIINSSGCVEEGSSMVETGDGDPRSHHNHNHNLASNSQVYLEGGEKLTVDFLGVEPGKKRSYGGNIMNLQQSFRNLPSNR
ncbi:hypothetical protein PTKIN_Ptkin02bG0113400 [Pterospermum kingtungense]